MKITTTFVLMVFAFFVLCLDLSAQYFANKIGPRYILDDTVSYQWRSVENAIPIQLTGGGSFRNNFDQDDDRFAHIDIGFEFKYFDTTVTKVIVTTNGTIHIPHNQEDPIRGWHAGSTYFNENTDLTGTSEFNYLAVLWDDLFIGDGTILYETVGEIGSREFIVTWHDVKRMGTPASNGVFFQAVFVEATQEIIFNYHDVVFGTEAYDFGKSSTVGLSNSNGTSRTIYSYDEASLRNGLSLRFHYEEGVFPSIITSPNNGTVLESNEVLVTWDYAGQVPDAVYIALGTYLGGERLGYYKIKNPWHNENPLPDSLLIKELPANGEPVYIKLIVAAEDGGRYESNTVCYPPSKDSYTIYGTSGAYMHGGRSLGELGVSLFKKLPTGKALIRFQRTDFLGLFRFADIEPGDYEIIIKGNSIFGGYGKNFSREFSVVDQDIRFNEKIFLAVRETTPKKGATVYTVHPTFTWKDSSYADEFLIVVNDFQGNEIIRETLSSNIYTIEQSLEPHETYFWTISSIYSGGHVDAQTRNNQFQVSNNTTPIILSPLVGEINESLSLIVKWSKESTNVEKWKIELRSSIDGEPYLKEEFPSTTFWANFQSLPINEDIVYIKLWFLVDGTWNFTESYCNLPAVDLNLELISPTPGSILSKDEQTFVFQVTGMSVDLLQDNFSLSFESPNTDTFYPDNHLVGWTVDRDENTFSATLNVLPAMGEPLILKANLRVDGVKNYLKQTYSFQTYNNGLPGLTDYQIDESFAYEWIDATDGVRIASKGEGRVADVPIPFTFNYYGQNYDWIKITEDGLAVFASHYWNKHANFNLPSPDFPNATLAPLAEDYDLKYGGGIFYKTIGNAPDRRFVIQWNKVAFEESWNDTNVTFQIVLNESTNEIVFQYKDVFFGEKNNLNSYNYGAGSVIGLENQDGTRATVYSLRSPVLRDESAIRFIPR